MWNTEEGQHYIALQNLLECIWLRIICSFISLLIHSPPDIIKMAYGSNVKSELCWLTLPQKSINVNNNDKKTSVALVR
jgi:hypothetical protein